MESATHSRQGVTDLPDVLKIPLPRRSTVFFVVYTSFGYGHLARSHRIARALVARAPVDAHVIGCQPGFSVGDRVPAVHEVDLPAPIVMPDGVLDDLPRAARLRGLTPDMTIAELSAIKSGLLLSLVRRLRPRAIVIDSFPFAQTPGRDAAECEETLAFLSTHSPGTLRCGGFRGVESLARDAIQGTTCRRLIDKYLDLLFIYMDERERGAFFESYPFLRPIEAKTRFVGYVAPPPAEAPPAPRGLGQRILATFGAGVDSYHKARLVCDAFLTLAATRRDLTLDVLTGHRLGDLEHRTLLESYGRRGPLRFSTFMPGLSTRLADYDLVLGMGGYNTCVELHAAGTRAILLPRVSATNQEQWHEALKFQARGGADHVVDSTAVSPDALARLIADTLAAPPARREPLDLGGAPAAAEILGAELARRGALAGPRASAGARSAR